MKAEYLITGAAGQLGAALLKLLGNSAVGTDLPEVDVTQPDSIRAAVDRVDPQWIINCATVVDVDLCQRKPDLAFEVNSGGVRNLAMTGRKLLTISTDHVFTGFKGQKAPFLEGDKTSPANVYGESKLLGEAEALNADPENIVIRTSWMFSSMKGMIPFFWKSLSEEGEVMAVSDQIACLTFAQDLAEVMGADVSCSRPIVDSKWLEKSRQVGTSGQTVKPKVYLACGISGSFQHLGGIKGSPFIVAVNKNPKAPIFQVADVGVITDILEFMPELTDKLKEMK